MLFEVDSPQGVRGRAPRASRSNFASGGKGMLAKIYLYINLLLEVESPLVLRVRASPASQSIFSNGTERMHESKSVNIEE